MALREIEKKDLHLKDNNILDQGFPTFWLLCPPKHQLHSPNDAIVPKRPQLRHLLRPPIQIRHVPRLGTPELDSIQSYSGSRLM